MIELVERYRGQVFGLCYRMLGCRTEAEDVAQETFIRVLRSLANWDSGRDFEPWLLAIAANRCRTALAMRQRRPTMHPLDEDRYLPDRRGESRGDGIVEEVQLALSQIRPEYREAFALFHDHELSYDEIAEILHRPLGTIKTWIRRARRELMQRLKARGIVGVET